MKDRLKTVRLFMIMAVSIICFSNCKVYVHATEVEQTTTKSTEQAAENSTQDTDQTEEIKSPETGKVGLSSLKKKIKKELKGKNGQWSVYVKNLDTNEYMVINDKKLPSASLIKLYVMLASYEEKENSNIDDKTFESLMKKMITVSDNESANELTIGLSDKGTFSAGAKKLNSYCKANGYNKTKFVVEMGKSSPKNVTSAKNCGWALERMYRKTAVSKKSSKKMIKLLKAQTRRNKIPAGVPKGVRVANKTGETAFAENDAAIVYSDGADYIIVVMSKNGKGAAAEVVRLSQIVYNYFN